VRREAPFDVPPHSTVEIPCEFLTFAKDRFANQVHIFVGDPYLTEYVVTVSGQVTRTGYSMSW
jgi:hypothetical protein